MIEYNTVYFIIEAVSWIFTPDMFICDDKFI